MRPFAATLDDGYGYYLITHPEGLSDTAIALFRSWLIERFGTAAAPEHSPAGASCCVQRVRSPMKSTAELS